MNTKGLSGNASRPCNLTSQQQTGDNCCHTERKERQDERGIKNQRRIEMQEFRMDAHLIAHSGEGDHGFRRMATT